MLIDTHALIWYALSPERLSRRASNELRATGHCYSHVSLWEMAIKNGKGTLQLRTKADEPTSAKQFLLTVAARLELSPLALEFDDLAEVEALPPHHKDPFDRLLVVQAQRNNLPIVSADPVFERYGVKRVW